MLEEIMPVIDTVINTKYIIPNGNVLTGPQFNGTIRRLSSKEMPESLPEIEYDPDDHVRKVQTNGKIYFMSKVFRVGKAFQGEYVAIRPTREDGVFTVIYCSEKIKELDLKMVDKTH